MKLKEKRIFKPSSATNTPLDSLLKYIFACLLFFIPLYPKFPLFNVPGTYVAIRAEDFIIAVLAFVMLLGLINSSFRLSITKNPLLIPILGYALIGFLSLLSGTFLTRTTTLNLGFLHWLRRLEYLIPFFAAAHLAKVRSNLVFFLKLTPVIAFAVFAYGLAQIYLKAPVISTQNEEFAKGYALTLQPGVNLSSTFAGHYDLSAYLTLILLIVTALLFTYKQKFLKFPHILLVLCLYWLQLQTGSRITFFMTIVGLIIFFWFSLRRKFILLTLVLGLIGGLTTPSLSGRFGTLINIFRFDTIQEKVKGVFDTRGFILAPPAYASTLPVVSKAPNAPKEAERAIQQDRSTSIRFDIEWPRAIRAFLKNPFFGTGFNSLGLATDSDYLRALGETGLLGLIAWLTLFITLLTVYLKKLKTATDSLSRNYLLANIIALLSFLVIAIFLDIFESSKPSTLFWMYAGLAVGLLPKSPKK